MKDLQEFLSERELFVIENHPAMSYGKIGERLGITGNRVAQIKTMALRKIREEKRREEARERGQQQVDYKLTRSQSYLVIRALGNYASIWCCSAGVFERYFPLGAAPSIPILPVLGQNPGQKEAPGHRVSNQALKLHFGSYCLTAPAIAARGN